MLVQELDLLTTPILVSDIFSILRKVEHCLDACELLLDALLILRLSLQLCCKSLKGFLGLSNVFLSQLVIDDADISQGVEITLGVNDILLWERSDYVEDSINS